MTLKPSSATWFETYTPRNLTVYAIEALAQTGVVELTHDALSVNIMDADLIRSLINQYNHLASRFEEDLPHTVTLAQTHEASPEQLAEDAYKVLRQWCADLLRHKRRIAHLTKEIDELELIRELLEALPDHDVDFRWLLRKSHILYKKLFVCPSGQFSQPSGNAMYVEVFPADEKDFLLALGTPEHAETVEAAAVLTGCRAIGVPEGLELSADNLQATVVVALNHAKEKLVEINSTLADHKQDDALKESIVTIRLLRWYLENSSPKTHQLCHLIGWTSAASEKELESALQKKGVKAKVFFSEKPTDRVLPVMTHYQKWVQPFSFFVNMAGTLRSDEVDPTPLLAIIVPLLFGYMFPDVGHGFLLLISGFLLRNRFSQAAILVPCGLAAMAFGVVFGDVFGRHDILEAMWIRPLEEPLLVLMAPLVLGGVLMTTGLVFSGIEAKWRNKLAIWMQTEAPVLCLYLVMIMGIFLADILWLIIPMLLWYLAGILLNCDGQRPGCMLKGLGYLLESMLRLVLNSVSFVRVGAFALAHSGSSLAINQIASMIEQEVILVIFLVLGHIFIIVLEGLIVFVQTSRLIMFEFFIRFLRADGRVFKPMHALD
jgi:V/A-type H+-transporting ATPase subunit I